MGYSSGIDCLSTTYRIRLSVRQTENEPRSPAVFGGQGSRPRIEHELFGRAIELVIGKRLELESIDHHLPPSNDHYMNGFWIAFT